MNEIGLLASVRKYKVSGNDPLENFITEAFAWVLNNTKFSHFLLKQISIKINNQSIVFDGYFETQFTYKNLRPDMVYLCNESIPLIFEHKVWAHLREGQIEDYKSISEDSFIVMISAGEHQHLQNADCSLCWKDISEWISLYLINSEREENEAFILRDFQNLLLNEGLGPQEDIQLQSIASYLIGKKLTNQCIRFFNRLIKDSVFLNNKILKEGHSFFEKDSVEWSSKESSGRIGLYIGKWHPAIFVGFMLNDEYHSIEFLDHSKGPEFIVTLCFDEVFHGEYKKNSDYFHLFERLKKDLPSFDITDTSLDRANPWHPLFIRKSMFDIFKNTATYEEQRDNFIKEMNDVLESIFREQEIINLKKFLLESKGTDFE